MGVLPSGLPSSKLSMNASGNCRKLWTPVYKNFLTQLKTGEQELKAGQQELKAELKTDQEELQEKVEEISDAVNFLARANLTGLNGMFFLFVDESILTL